MKSSPLRTTLHILAALVFGVFAWFQRNDIDPEVYHNPSALDSLLWFIFYLFIAVLFVVTIFRPIPKWVLIVAALACLAEMVLTGPGLFENLFGEDEFTMTQVSMSAEDPRVELSREFFGAVIALAGVLALFLSQRALGSGSAAKNS